MLAENDADVKTVCEFYRRFSALHACIEKNVIYAARKETGCMFACLVQFVSGLKKNSSFTRCFKAKGKVETVFSNNLRT